MSKVAFSATVDNKAMLRALNVFEKDLAPSVMAETLNKTADAVTTQMQRNIKSDFTLRTPFTLKSTESPKAKPWKALNKAMGKMIDKMFSRAGTFSKYLWKQENGGTIKAEAGGAYPIATLNARTSGSYQKSIAKKNRLAPGSLNDGDYDLNRFIGTPKGGSRGRGLYARNKNNTYLVKMRDLGSDTITIKATHFHQKAVDKFGTASFITAMFNKIAVRELKKRGWNG